jgi:hypothetical protein
MWTSEITKMKYYTGHNESKKPQPQIPVGELENKNLYQTLLELTFN